MIDSHYGSETERTAPGIHDAVQKYLLDNSLLIGKNFTDVGAGTGAWARRLLANGAIQVQAVEWGDIKNQPALIAFKRDLNDSQWHYDLEKSDIVTCLEVVEHIENQAILLNGIRSILNVDGIAVITTPNLHSLRARLKLLISGNLRQFDSQGDPTHFSPIFLHPFSKVCERAGFAIDRVWTYPEKGKLQVGLKGTIADIIGRLIGDKYRGDTLCIALRVRN